MISHQRGCNGGLVYMRSFILFITLVVVVRCIFSNDWLVWHIKRTVSRLFIRCLLNDTSSYFSFNSWFWLSFLSIPTRRFLLSCSFVAHSQGSMACSLHIFCLLFSLYLLVKVTVDLCNWSSSPLSSTPNTSRGCCMQCCSLLCSKHCCNKRC